MHPKEGLKSVSFRIFCEGIAFLKRISYKAQCISFAA